MANDSLEQLLQKLLQQLKTAQIRAVFLLQGAPEWQLQQVQKVAKHLPVEHYLIDTPVTQTSTLANQIHISRYRDILGSTARHVVLHMREQLHLDALAATLGTLQGGGIATICLPTDNSPMLQRLIAKAQAGIYLVSPLLPLKEQLLQARADAELAPQAKPKTWPTSAQRSVIDHLLADKHPQFVLADRGRGKSTAMGLAIRQYLETTAQPDQIIVTAPRRHSATTLLEAAGEHMGVTFIPWDKLLQLSPATTDSRLVIDEAAAMPRHVLDELLTKFNVWMLATTVDGYEGCGRGVAALLAERLTEGFTAAIHQLHEPLRWSIADNIETWLNDALLLKFPDPLVGCASSESQLPNFHYSHAAALTDTELASCFQLLLDAHYQSSPNDLRLLLDDPQQRLLLAYQAEQIVGVVWLASEGPVSAALHQDILQGRRRPAGQLLPQSLGYYCQYQPALSLRCLRVVRIAVHQHRRHQGVGAALLRQVRDIAQKNAIDAVGTVFGGQPKLLSFWQKAGYQLVRQGRKANMASGYPSVIMLQPVTTDRQLLLDANELTSIATAERDWLNASTKTTDSLPFERMQHIIKAFKDGYLPFDCAQFSLLHLRHSDAAPKLDDKLWQLLGQPLPTTELARQAEFANQTEFVRYIRNQFS